MKKRLLFMLLVVVLLAAACMPSPEQMNQDVEKIVQATFQALTAQAVPPTPAVEVVTTGSISGQVTSGISHVGVFQVGTDTFYKLELTNGVEKYQIDNIPAGTYYVLAFTSPGGAAAPFPLAYSQYVVCGLTENCTDHALVPVNVTAGQITTDINIFDNYGLPDRNPYLDKYFGYDQNSGTDVIATFTPAAGQTGSISGTLSYPSEGIPALAVIAFDSGGNSTDYYYVLTQQGNSTYQIDNLPAGNYYVVSYVIGGGLSGGYSQAVPCGLSAECGDHSLIAVPVTGGQVTTGVNPGDWYAPPDTFPAYPLP